MVLAPQHQAAVDAAAPLSPAQLATITAIFRDADGRGHLVVETPEGLVDVPEFSEAHRFLCEEGFGR